MIVLSESELNGLGSWELKGPTYSMAVILYIMTLALEKYM